MIDVEVSTQYSSIQLLKVYERSLHYIASNIFISIKYKFLISIKYKFYFLPSIIHCWTTGALNISRIITSWFLKLLFLLYCYWYDSVKMVCFQYFTLFIVWTRCSSDIETSNSFPKNRPFYWVVSIEKKQKFQKPTWSNDIRWGVIHKK